MKNEKGFSLVEIIFTLLMLSGTVIITMDYILSIKVQKIQMISEKAVLIEYHQICEIFYNDYQTFEDKIQQYYSYSDNYILIKPYKLDKEYNIILEYKVSYQDNIILYTLDVSFPEELKNGNMEYFDSQHLEVIVYE